MEQKRYIVDGLTLVNHIHLVKDCVYNDLLRIHVPLCALEVVEGLYKKSLEPKEQPKVEKPKRWSGKPRREQPPLFDINPRTTREFLERAQADSGIPGVTFQAEGEDFSQWKENELDQVQEEAKPPPPPNSFSEALLRTLNIKEADTSAEDLSSNPKVISRSSNNHEAPLERRGVPRVPVSSVPADMRSLLSCALWQTHEAESDPLKAEALELLSDNKALAEQAKALDVSVLTGLALRAQVLNALLIRDHREAKGELEDEFPDYQQRKLTTIRELAPTRNVHENIAEATGPIDEVEEKALEAVALSVVQGLEQPDVLDKKSEEQTANFLAAEIRPSVSYAMAAGALSSLSTNITPPTLQAYTPPDKTPEATVKAMETISPSISANAAVPKAAAEPAKMDDDIDSDEEVVVFNPRARQAAQSSKKRQSRELQRPASAVTSRPTTANGPSSLPTSPRPSSIVTKSVLKPDSPVFSPRQPFTGVASMMQSTNLTSPTFGFGDPVSPGRGTSPPQRASTTSPQVLAKQPPNGPRSNRKNGANRPNSQEAVQRQSELILQRQREAIKRSSQTQEENVGRDRQGTNEQSPPIQIEMRPTNNPVVIDPDDFGRHYTIKPGAKADAALRGKGEGGRRRGGRGRGGKGQQRQHQQHPSVDNGSPLQQPPPTSRDHGADFVLKSGQARGVARGQGKLWTP